MREIFGKMPQAHPPLHWLEQWCTHILICNSKGPQGGLMDQGCSMESNGKHPWPWTGALNLVLTISSSALWKQFSQHVCGQRLEYTVATLRSQTPAPGVALQRRLLSIVSGYVPVMGT